MNRKIGMFGALVNLVAVITFAASMLMGSNLGGYFSSMFIAFSFVLMTCSYAYFSKDETKVAGITAVGFSAMYAAIISLVYFTQITTVQNDSLTQQATKILDYQQFGLFFNYDMLGYALMSLATLFAGLTVETKSTASKWLKGLLLVHGVFFVSCIIIPTLGLFSTDMVGTEWIGIAILEFWCIYFIPVGILSLLYFSKYES